MMPKIRKMCVECCCYETICSAEFFILNQMKQFLKQDSLRKGITYSAAQPLDAIIPHTSHPSLNNDAKMC